MHVAHAHALLVEIFGQVLGHALGEHGDQRAIALRRRLANFAKDIVDLGLGGAHLDRRIDQAGRADDLLGEDAAGALHLPAARRRRDVGRLRAHEVPFLEAQRPVVHAGRQAEAVFGERRLAAKIAAIHAADLRDGDVALVDEDQRVVRQILEQGGRRLARLAAGEIARIVLDAGAGAGRLDHLDVETAALLQPLRFQQAAGGGELGQPQAQLLLDALHRLGQRRPRRHIMRIGVDLDLLEVARLLAGQRIELGDRTRSRRRTARRARRGPPGGRGTGRPCRRARGRCRDESRRRRACSAAPPGRRATGAGRCARPPSGRRSSPYRSRPSRCRRCTTR